jgi:transglutaminase-like putative cysteine protease
MGVLGNYRRTLAAALATVLASISLYPIFYGWTWFWAGVGAVLTVAVAGTLTRLRRLPVIACLGGGVLALLLYLNFAFENARSFYHLLPTPNSLRSLWDLAGTGFSQAAQYAPPVPELHGMLLLAAGGIGITALLTDLIAVRLESAALAGLPLLLLFTEPFTLSLSRSGFETTVAFCLAAVGYLTLLSSEGRDRIREWEQPNPGPLDVPDTRVLAAAGRRVGLASVALALIVPVFVPGLHVTRLFGGGQAGIGGNGGGGAGAVGFPDPNTQLSKELHTSQPTTVFIYHSSETTPQYLQIYALDNLTSSGWQMFSQPESLVPVSPGMPAPPGLTGDQYATPETTNITISSSVAQDALQALPVPYPATAVAAPGTLKADKNSLMLFDDGVQLAGLSYSVNSLDVSPPAQILDSAPAPSSDIAAHYLEVPGSYYPLRDLAESVVKQAGAKTAFQDAVALQDWLSGGAFKYTLSAPTVTNATSLTTFLETAKKGYCQQFSFAMAVLARLLGIPSRVAYGFTAGTPGYGGTWVVTTHDAHAWPELYFQGAGWLRFEPTPAGATGQGTATAPAYSLEPDRGFSGSGTQTSPDTTPTTSASGRNRTAAQLGQHLGVPAAGVGDGGAVVLPSAPLSPWAVFGLCVLGLLVITAMAPVAARLAIRRRRWRRGARGGDIALAHAAWRELRDDLVDYGAGYQPSESPRAAAARAAAEFELVEPAVTALRRIALAEERARYAASPDSGMGLRQDSAVVRRAIAATVPRWTRWRARLMPASVLAPSLVRVGQAADVFGRLNPEWFSRSRLNETRLRRGRSGEQAPAHDGDGAGDAGDRAEPPVPAGGARPR